ncbi:hypothetical protein B0H21DRAFT_754928 [Amylocystis lapponica]|nr:hypothetical protein B0H21DRAFT_754928 [Amylocystis lapponica]
MSCPDAPAPFNNHAADAIIHSSDNFSFYVRRAIISEASPVFEAMFSLPQSPASDTSGDLSVPIIPVMEDVQTLEKLFRICYPVVDPVLETLQEVSAVLAAALKYKIDVAIHLCTRALLSPMLIQSDHVGAYAVAVQLKLQEEARAIALHALRYPLSLTGVPSWALKHIPAHAYHALLQYRLTCSNHVQELVKSLARDVPLVAFVCPKCSNDGSTRQFEVDEEQFYSRVVEALDTTPCGVVLLEDDEMGSTSAVLDFSVIKCGSCLAGIHSAMLEFLRAIAADVDSCVSQVQLNID